MTKDIQLTKNNIIFSSLAVPSIDGSLDEFTFFKNITFAEINSNVALKQGLYEFSFFADRPLGVEISNKNECIFHCKIAKQDGLPLIQNLIVNFKNPLILSNVLHNLSHMHEVASDNNLRRASGWLKVFSDNNLAELVNKFELTIKKGIHEGLSLVERLEKNINETLPESFKKDKGSFELPVIELDQIIGKPIKVADLWHLEFFYSGRVVFIGQTINTFKELGLAHLIIPSMHADLSKLLSSNPFASAELNASDIPITKVLHTALQTLSSLQSKLKAQIAVDYKVKENLFQKLAKPRIKTQFSLESQVNIIATKKGFKLHDSTTQIQVDNFNLSVNDYSLKSSGKLSFSLTKVNGYLNSFFRSKLNFIFSANGIRNILLQTNRGQSKLFPTLLNSMKFTIHLDEANNVNVHLAEGDTLIADIILLLKDSNFNEAIKKLTSDKRLQLHLEDLLTLFSPKVRARYKVTKKWITSFSKTKEKLAVHQIKDLIASSRLALFFSQFLYKSNEHIEVIEENLTNIIAGKGFNVNEVFRLADILSRSISQNKNLKFLLHFLNTTLLPISLQTPASQTSNKKHSPSNRYMVLQESETKYKSGRQIYQADFHSFSELQDEVPYLSQEQVRFMQNMHTSKIPENAKKTLKYLLRLFQMTKSLNESPFKQWKGDALLRLIIENQDIVLPSHAVMATVMEIHISYGQSLPTSRYTWSLLINFLNTVDAKYTIGIISEMSNGNCHRLTSVLYGLFSLDDSLFPLPLNKIIEQAFSLTVPHRSDFLTNGKYSNDSFYEALYTITQKMMPTIYNYYRTRDYIQTYRATKAKISSYSLPELVSLAILKSDKFAQSCDCYNLTSSKTKEAIAYYQNTFQLCRDLIQDNLHFLLLPQLKEFYRRNYEALMVLSVVNNYLEDVDNVRAWLHKRCKVNSIASRKELFEHVIDALYYDSEVKLNMKQDYLVQLAIDNQAGTYNFTIVSCMGIITEGSQGKELQNSFERLTQKRGITILRADTGTLRSLEDNAQKIVEKIKNTKGPWGVIGYSQGCANALFAESYLHKNYPIYKDKIENFKCRHLMFAAHNGSIHQATSEAKMLLLFSQAEKFLKQYQTQVSRALRNLFLNALSSSLNSSIVTQLLGGLHSLSQDAVEYMAHTGIYKEAIPTTTIRAIVEPETLPEANEYLSNMLTLQAKDKHHDTQVHAYSGKGYFTQFDTSASTVLEHCNINSHIQRTHHWSPLFDEIKNLKTRQDVDFKVYDVPKDRHISPWIEVNARFGVILCNKK